MEARLACRLWRRTFSSTKVATHYDVLGVSPKSTQAEIKKAYYELSKAHHPDINKDPTSSKKFTAISQAYEILGNIRLKKLYDRGVIQNQFLKHSTEPSEVNRVKIKKAHVNSSEYNYDEWTKLHYTESFEKHQSEIRRIRFKRRVVSEKQTVKDSFVGYLFLVLSVVALIFALSVTDDYDDPNRPLVSTKDGNSSKSDR